MYQYNWDNETGGILLTTEQSKFSKEPRPVYFQELDILGFDKHWNYPKDDSAPLLWAEANNYIYKGKLVAKTKGGSLYSKPELILLEDPEPNNAPLQLVDLEKMCQKNKELMETLEQDTIKKIYNTYREYKNKIDIFYVAFSGGKDSIVALDLVQRALPHNDFKVIFSDTGMEFPDTYNTCQIYQEVCNTLGIDFYIAKSEFSPLDTWKKFGPPCSVTRWCCSVHKTAPQILLLRQLIQKNNFKGMAFVGVRADESLTRSKYDYISYGEKHKGQYSCNVILNWNSAEIYLYIYLQKLFLNITYKKGNRRAGCLICPRAAERNDFMNHFCYINEAEPFIDIIRTAYSDTFTSTEQLENFISNGGWKARKNGRDINVALNYKEHRTITNEITLSITNPKTQWKEWIKTIGTLITDNSLYTIKYKNQFIQFVVKETDNEITVIISPEIAKNYPEFVKLIKNVFRKSACCVNCKECQANCPYGNLEFNNNQVIIKDSCIQCGLCHSIEKGCLVYKSLEAPKGTNMIGKNMSLNSYSHHAPKEDWIKQFFDYKNEFDSKHSLGSQMYNFFKRFLRDSKLLDSTGFSSLAKQMDKIGFNTEKAWGIIFTNLCYTPQVNWFTTHINFDQEYSKQLLSSMLIDSGAKESWTGDIISSFNRLSELKLGEIGFGHSIKEKNKFVGITRSPWASPIPEVILYSLYKFAEACDNYYQFSLETLLDDSIERAGVSPTRIFGLDRETMIKILNGLSISYPEFISASFTLDLDNITLRDDKSSEDVLSLF